MDRLMGNDSETAYDRSGRAGLMQKETSVSNMVDREAFAREMNLDDEIIRELYGYFAEELREDITHLAEIAGLADRLAYAHCIHKIKGTSSSYKACELAELAKQADAFCKQEEWDRAFSLSGAVLSAADDVLKELERI